MKIAFAVNRVETEQDNYTTIRLARKASALGHEVALIGLGDFIYDAEGSICAMATVGQQKKFKSDKTYLAHLHDAENVKQRICIGDYDILMLRSDPAEELGERDVLRFEEQIDGWLGVDHVKVLGLRYEGLWDNVDALSNFVGFPVVLPEKELRRSRQEMDMMTAKRFAATYRQLDEKIAALPDCVLTSD